MCSGVGCNRKVVTVCNVAASSRNARWIRRHITSTLGGRIHTGLSLARKPRSGTALSTGCISVGLHRVVGVETPLIFFSPSLLPFFSFLLLRFLLFLCYYLAICKGFLKSDTPNYKTILGLFFMPHSFFAFRGVFSFHNFPKSQALERYVPLGERSSRFRKLRCCSC